MTHTASSDQPVRKAKICLRLPWFQYGIEAWRNELLAWVKTYPGTIDEVAMFTGVGMFPPDLRVVERQVADLKKVMPMFRALGLSAGIDQHTTIGCQYERPGQTLNQPWQKMVGVDGTVCTCYCASDPRMQDYIRRLYVMLAESGPEFHLDGRRYSSGRHRAISTRVFLRSLPRAVRHGNRPAMDARKPEGRV